MIEVRTLGTVGVRGADGSELASLLAQPKLLALLIYLALASRRSSVRRDSLLGLLWPEHEERRARASLRQALHGLRQHLGAEVILTRGDDEVTLDPEAVWCDAIAFEDFLSRGELDQAVELYRGPILEGFLLRGSVDFDQWVERERDRLARAYTAALEELADQATQRREPDVAVQWWRRLVERVPYSTRVTVRVMEALEAAGDRAGALEHAQRYASRMREDLDAAPSPDVIALAQRLREQPVGHATLRSATAAEAAGGDLLAGLQAALAGRYAVQRQVGAGSMATVFLADDLKHQRKVALKVLRPELATAIPWERFLREIQVAANLHHPHILALYDSGEASGFLYYVMPYVEGETLRDRLNREKQLTIDDATGIASDVADALSYAHTRGVVHRDIKPENILLESGHAVVADFGIARAIMAVGSERLTGSGMTVGTAAYMSPEQAGGDADIDGRSDLYSLACVLYEMLAGQPPFTGVTIESIVRQHVAVDPASVTALRPAVPAHLSDALARALAKVPADRFDPVTQFAVAITTETGRSSRHRAPRGVNGAGDASGKALRRIEVGRKARYALIATAVAVTLGAAALLMRTVGPPELDPDRVVVNVFQNQTGDSTLDVWGRMAADWITQSLVHTGLVNVIPTTLVLEAVTGADAEAGAQQPTQSYELARKTRAGTVVAGSYYVQGDSVLFRAEVIDARARRVVRAVDAVSGPLGEPLEAIDSLGQRVMATLAGMFDPRLAQLATVARSPPTFRAYQEYITAFDFLLVDDSEALRHLYRAAEADSTYVMPLLLAAFSEWPFMSVSDSISRVVGRMRERLTPYERILLAWLEAAVRNDEAGALSAARRAVEMAPVPEYVLYYASTALGANRPQEALDALSLVEPELNYLRETGYYPIFRIWAYHVLGNYRRELPEARALRQRHPTDFQVVEGELQALAALGRIEELHSVLDETLALPIEGVAPYVGANAGGLMRIAALELRVHGYDDDAPEVLDRAIAWYHARPMPEADPEHKYHLAETLYLAERWEDAQALFEELRSENPSNHHYRAYLGAIAARRGDHAEARAIAVWLETPEAEDFFFDRNLWRARMAALLGEPERAVNILRNYRGGYDIGQHREFDFESLRDYPPFLELVRPKG